MLFGSLIYKIIKQNKPISISQVHEVWLNLRILLLWQIMLC